MRDERMRPKLVGMQENESVKGEDVTMVGDVAAVLGRLLIYFSQRTRVAQL